MSDSHYYNAAFTTAAFQVASETALSCHQRVPCGHEEDRFLKRKKKNQKRTGKVKNKGNSLWNNFHTGRPCLICFPNSEMEAKVLSLLSRTKLGKVKEAVTWNNSLSMVLPHPLQTQEAMPLFNNESPPSTLITNIKTEFSKDSACAWKTVSGALSLHPHLAEVEKAGTPDSSLSWILKQFLEIARWLFLFLSYFKSISEYSRMTLHYQTNSSE